MFLQVCVCPRGGGIPACLAGGIPACLATGLQGVLVPGDACSRGCLLPSMWGGGGVGVWWRRPPLPADGYWCRRYASYWKIVSRLCAGKLFSCEMLIINNKESGLSEFRLQRAIKCAKICMIWLWYPCSAGKKRTGPTQQNLQHFRRLFLLLWPDQSITFTELPWRLYHFFHFIEHQSLGLKCNMKQISSQDNETDLWFLEPYFSVSYKCQL